MVFPSSTNHLDNFHTHLYGIVYLSWLPIIDFVRQRCTFHRGQEAQVVHVAAMRSVDVQCLSTILSLDETPISDLAQFGILNCRTHGKNSLQFKMLLTGQRQKAIRQITSYLHVLRTRVKKYCYYFHLLTRKKQVLPLSRAIHFQLKWKKSLVWVIWLRTTEITRKACQRNIDSLSRSFDQAVERFEIRSEINIAALLHMLIWCKFCALIHRYNLL